MKNLGSPIFMKILPEKYFDARNSLVAKFFENFYPQGVILGVKGQFYGVFDVKKGQKSRFSDFYENFTRKAFWCGKLNGGKMFRKYWPQGGHFGDQRSILGFFDDQKGQKSRLSDFYENFSKKYFENLDPQF